MPYLTHAPGWLRALMPPGLIWRGPEHQAGGQPVVYLTFDDGPHPKITPCVLDMLSQYEARATFFCLGSRVEQYPEVYASILAAGHAVGNHTQHHLNGWKTNPGPYLADVEACARVVDTGLFRPPYGRISRAQAAALQSGDRPLRVVMWDVLSADFDATRTADFCRDTVLRLVRPGSIVVFHDSEKAWPRLKDALPEVLPELLARGFAFERLHA